ncbi:hypothetical protein COO60DRAFT_804471 [Scenedesmus sp. NREL 46B-D3]|nr:hypothetical protein COO60DRAFT_804471 [Scenedesmus sp. NREL 46B-D3]
MLCQNVGLCFSQNAVDQPLQKAADSSCMTPGCRAPGQPPHSSLISAQSMAQPQRTAAWLDGIVKRLWPGLLPSQLESNFRETRARRWWLRDIVNFMIFAVVASLVYVLAACYLDALAITQPGANSSSYTGSSSLGSASSPACRVDLSALQPNQSTSFQAPSATECSKLRLFPPCSAAEDHARPSLVRSASFAPPAPASSAATQPTLQQQLYSKAAGAVASLSSGCAGGGSVNGSGSGGMLLRPRKLLQQVPLLYLWRLWFVGDLFLVSKLGLCLACLACAIACPAYYRRQATRTLLITAYMVLPLALLAARLATCQQPHTIAPPAAGAFNSAKHPSEDPAPTSAAAAAGAAPATPPVSPLPYLATCPVPASAELYRSLLPYASLVVMLDNWLHPLPLPWQAAVNVASWLCLTSCGVLLRVRYLPAVTTGSGDAAAGGAMSAVASGNSAHGSASQLDVEVMTWELAAHCVDGLLLAVLLPLAVSAWAGQRARKWFLQTLQQQQQVDASTAQRISRENLQPTYAAAAHVAASNTTSSNSSWIRKATSAIKRFIEGRRYGLGPGVAPAAAAAAVVALEPTNAADPGSMGISANNSTSSSRAARPADAGLAQPPGLDSKSRTSSNIALAPATPATSDTLRVAARHSVDEDKRRSLARNSQQPAAGTVFAAPAASTVAGSSSPATSARCSMESRSSSRSDGARMGSHSSSSSSSMRGKTNGGEAGGNGSSSQQPGSRAGGAHQPAQQQQQQQPVAAAAAAAAAAQAAGLQVGCSSPRSPSSALYQSPLETVVISFKLASAPSSRGAAAAPAGAVAAGPAAVELGELGGAAAAVSLPQHQGLVASGASSQLRADIEAAVRAVVAQSQLQVLTTSVSSFPGCVHVVMSVSLGTAELLEQLAAEAAAAAAAAAAAGAAASATGASTSSRHSAVDQGIVRPEQEAGRGAAGGDGDAAPAAAAASPPLASLVKWDRVVQQLQQRMLQTAAQEGAAAASEPLQLRYMMVQDSTAQTTHWMWQAPGTADAGSAAAPPQVAGSAAAAAAVLPAAAAGCQDEAAVPADVSIGDVVGAAPAFDVGLSGISSPSSSGVRVTVASADSASPAAGLPLTLSDVLAAAGDPAVQLSCISSRIVSSADGPTVMTTAPLVAAGVPVAGRTSGSSSSSGQFPGRRNSAAAGASGRTGTSPSAGATMLAAAAERQRQQQQQQWFCQCALARQH